MRDNSGQSRGSIRVLVFAWIVLIASGASTTGLLRAPLANPWLAASTYQAHRIAGAAIGLLAIVQLLLLKPPRPATWLRAALVGGAIVMGWLSTRSLAPRIVAVHAFMAAFAAVALATAVSALPAPGSPGPAPAPRAGWIHVTARLAFVLVAVQVAVGALLRHQQIALTWHLAAGGLAALALLTPAVALLQDADLPDEQRRSARRAIATVVVQVALGATVFLMVLMGPPSTAAWLATTIAHVTVGTLTLLAAARFASVVSADSR